MNLCALGQLPKEATSPGTPEPTGAARPGLANAIRHSSAASRSLPAKRLSAPGSGQAGKSPWSRGKAKPEPAPKEPFLKKAGRRGRAGGWGPHGTAGLGLPYLGGSAALIKEIDGRHQEDSEELVRAGLPKNNPPTPASSLARLPSGADSGRQRGCGDVTAPPEGPGAETTLILLPPLCWCLLRDVHLHLFFLSLNPAILLDPNLLLPCVLCTLARTLVCS